MRRKKQTNELPSETLSQLLMQLTATVVPLEDGRKSRAGLKLPIFEHRKMVLRTARANTKLGQVAFAKKIGRPVKYVNRHEQYKDHMTIDGVLEWADGCDMNAVVLFAQLVNRPMPNGEEPSCPT